MDVWTLKQSFGTRKLPTVSTCCNCCTSRTRLIDMKCSLSVLIYLHLALLNLIFYWYNDLPIFLMCKLPSNECIVWMIIPHHGIWIRRKPIWIKNGIPAVQSNLHQRKGTEWITSKIPLVNEENKIYALIKFSNATATTRHWALQIPLISFLNESKNQDLSL